MLLDRIEIDSHGPLSRVEIGPLSHHLNVLVGAPGSGKTAICRFVRDSLIDREYPRGMLSGSAGRVVWVDQNGWIHCRREQDGTPGGRRSVEFEPRSETAGIWDGYTEGWFDGPAANDLHRDTAFRADIASQTASSYRSSLASRSLGGIRIPESIVDGVMVDTTVSSVSRVVASCVAAGLDREDLARLPFENETAQYAQYGLADNDHRDRDDQHRRTLRSELADVEAELAKLNAVAQRYRSDEHVSATVGADIERLGLERAECVRRRDDLVARREAAIRVRSHYHAPVVPYTSPFGPIDARYGEPGYNPTVAASAGTWDANAPRLRVLHQRADSLRSRAAELQRWIAELDSQSHSRSAYDASLHGGLDLHASDYTLPRHWQTTSSDHLQNRIRQADREIVSLRRVLADVRGLRDLLGATMRSATPHVDSYDWLNDSWMRGRRYDHFVRAMDHYRSDRPWGDFYNHAYQSLRPVDDLAMRIEATTRHLDWLLSRFDMPGATIDSRTADPYTWIYENERGGTIEASLRRVRDQLRQRDYLSASHLDSTIVELTRSLDHLMVHRRRVVDSLASQHGNWKRDFAGLSGHQLDWVSERRAANEELASIENELRRVLDQTATLRHSQRYLPIVDPIYPIGMGSVPGAYATPGLYTGIDQGQSESLRAEVRSMDAEISRCNQRLSEIDVQIRSLRSRPVAVAVPNDEIARLRQRREEIIAELNRYRPVTRRESSLAELASRWLIRLSGGQHRVIRWTVSATATDPYTTLDATTGEAARYRDAAVSGRAEGRRVNVSIDNIDERNVTAATRAVACLATRMAAGELLGRMGHAIPLVLETHREIFAARDPQSYSADGCHHAAHPEAYQHWTREGISGDTIASAFADYAAAGRQLLVLTEHAPLADVLRRSGARHFALHTQRIVHPHRPLWRDGERHDRYTGPHAINVDGMPAQGGSNEMDWTDAGSVNRAFDRAWRDSAGLRDEASYCAAATDTPAAGAAYRDGYYYSDQSSTYPVASETTEVRHAAAGQLVSQSLTARHNAPGETDTPEVPFFLTVDSPIDAAPSIDAVAAQRLRRIGISHITHLMNQDSNRLADTLGLAGVDAKTVRRWQSECRLMCRVPQLRGFDARVLVGCGITDPAQLAAIHPTDLLDRVKTFLATERGQRILLSGTSYELSRITSWIASANQSVHTYTRSRTVDGRRVRTRVIREDGDATYESTSRSKSTPRTRYVENNDVYLTDDDFDQERYEVEVERRADRIVSDLDELARDYDSSYDGGSQSNRSSGAAGTSSSRSYRSSRSSRNGGERSSRSSNSSRSSSSSDRDRVRSERESRRRSESNRERSDRDRTRSSRSERESRSTVRSEGGDRDSNRSGIRSSASESNRTNRESSRSSSYDRDSRERSGRGESYSSRSSESTETGERVLKFYLERASDVVDAPSIGPRMAERLNKIGIYTVDDLLQADAEEIAEGLSHRRIDAATVLEWQQQATLVCRVPMMRGHDAQFLVAAGVTTPEELASSEPVSLFATVETIAHSNEGKRIVRGGKLPDLEEVTEWIEYASEHRPLKAA
ncbi:putative flap endonuclease-1-like 5' DNA nuclease [Rhodopirellula rubra]|uniref:Putative flap endonuclease-1-like 5' DNA nuclease n=1 Tax=Aporhodopirellula rubra TaxID=980271 RepID=A0A7W5E4Y2_9BACT|nr:DUF4332 domain-containing protein [Aporhodopirellula rubra]MBB3210296.1 putative flap endonuclease-1-like 5' DNA nuclease [Aporhodopirellula rubra]